MTAFLRRSCISSILPIDHIFDFFSQHGGNSGISWGVPAEARNFDLSHEFSDPQEVVAQHSRLRGVHNPVHACSPVCVVFSWTPHGHMDHCVSHIRQGTASENGGLLPSSGVRRVWFHAVSASCRYYILLFLHLSCDSCGSNA
jgi:hypothetical protein